MKYLIVFLGFLIVFLAALYLNPYVPESDKPLIMTESDEVAPETIIYEGNNYPATVPFKQGMTLYPGQSATVELKEFQVFNGFEELYDQYRAGFLDREDMEYFFGDSVWTKIAALEKKRMKP